MDVRLITDQGIEDRSPDELPALLRRDTGFFWVDIPMCDEEGARVLLKVFGSYPTLSTSSSASAAWPTARRNIF